MLMTPPTTEPRRFRVNIEAFELLDRAGMFDEFGKVELIEGNIEVVNAEFRRHNFVKNELTRRLWTALTALGSDFSAFSETSLALPSDNLPQPDVAVAKGGADDRYYELRDIAIIIEIADTTMGRDLGVKRAMYAAQGVPEYWVVALPTAEVHQFWTPSATGFIDGRTVPLAGDLHSATMPDLMIDGRAIL